jgi:malonyl-CoA/methylmalonyl-CoA synthetase
MANIYNLFHERSMNGGAFLKSADGSVISTYQHMEERSAQYANRLTDLGLKKGDRVIVQVEKSSECLLLYFGCLRAGLIYLPLNTAYQAHELEYFVGNATPKLVVCSNDNLRLFSSLGDAIVSTLPDGEGRVAGEASVGENPDGNTAVFQGLDSEGKSFQTTACQDDDIAVILYTSGTTGQPKGAMITHGNLAVNGLALHSAWSWQADDVMLHALPIFHIHGLFVATHLAVLNASPIIFLNKFDPTEVIGLLPSSTVYMGVPTNYVRLLANKELNASTCSNMRLFTSGSAPLLAQTFSEFESRTGHSIVERYGMTETGMNTSNPLTGKRKPGTVGLPLPGVSCRIVDDNDNDLTSNQTGDLLIKGENVFKGYWEMPEKTQDEFTKDGYFRTGDLAMTDEDGYVSIVGRNKDMIITGGFNVYPREIEDIIDRMQGVDESAVIGLAHSDFGEAVTAVIVKTPESTLDEDFMVAHLKKTLANFKVPKKIIFVDSLPRNTMGKVQKNVLRENYGQGQQ